MERSWLAYTVDVAVEGRYDLDLRVSSLRSGGQVRIELPGEDASPPIIVPETGDWQVYATATIKGLSLKRGRQTIRVVFATGTDNGHVCNFNWMAFRKSAG